jgi:hypothetical protein
VRNQLLSAAGGSNADGDDYSHRAGFDDYPGHGEDMLVEALVAQTAIERFNECIRTGLPSAM